MFEMTDSRENHGDIAFVSGIDDFRITHGAAGLNYGADSIFGRGHESICEWEKSVGSQGAALQGERRLHGAPFYGIHAAGLACADSEHARSIGENDGIGLHVLNDSPAEKEGCQLFRCRLPSLHRLLVMP